MKPSLNLAVAVAMAVHLTGCATSAVMKADAQALSTATAKMVVDSREFYRKLDEEKDAYMLRIVVGRPGCRLGWQAALVRRDDGGWRCMTDPEIRQYVACSAQPVDSACPGGVMPRALADMQPHDFIAPPRSAAFGLIAVCADYQALLASIVEDPKRDTAADLQALGERANALSSTLQALGAPAFGAVSYKDETAALGAVVDLIRQLQEDRHDLERLREIMSKPDGPGARFDAALARLQTRYASLDRGLYLDLRRRESDLALRAFNDAHPPAPAGYPAKPADDATYERARAIVQSRKTVEALAANPDALALQFDALAKAHAQLREAIVNGHYTEAQRKRIAQESLRRLKTWFDAIATLVRLF